VEFALVGIPMVFALISIVEMSRGMWIYHTENYAVNEGVRFVVVHGADCTSGTNTCGVTIDQIAHHLAALGGGLPPSQWNVTLYSATNAAQNCHPLSSCFGNMALWPQSPDDSVGSPVAISGSFAFQSALAMVWPGTQPVSFGTFNLPAYAQQDIQF
jgi:TadE-like protein